MIDNIKAAFMAVFSAIAALFVVAFGTVVYLFAGAFITAAGFVALIGGAVAFVAVGIYSELVPDKKDGT